MNDRENLLALAVVGNKVFAVFAGMFALTPMIPLMLGIHSLTARVRPDGAGDTALIFIALAVFLIAIFVTFAILSFGNARRIAARKGFTTVLSVSLFQSLFMPGIGTALGVFTLWLIHQDGVKIQFHD